VISDIDLWLARFLLPYNKQTGSALALDVHCSGNQSLTNDKAVSTRVDFGELFDGFLWGAVPKNRRSRERRATRQWGHHKITDYMTPKRNLIECLDCAKYHEAHTICGNCYQKVREETEAMKAKIDPDKRMFDIPQTEVVYVYQGEEDTRKTFNGKFVVEMNKPRPEWFPKNLLTKGHGKY